MPECPVCAEWFAGYARVREHIRQAHPQEVGDE